LRRNGRVKWFNTSTGLGCIRGDGGEEIAVQASAIFAEGFRALEEGQAVEFDVTQGPNGPQAEKVLPIPEFPE